LVPEYEDSLWGRTHLGNPGALQLDHRAARAAMTASMSTVRTVRTPNSSRSADPEELSRGRCCRGATSASTAQTTSPSALCKEKTRTWLLRSCRRSVRGQNHSSQGHVVYYSAGRAGASVSWRDRLGRPNHSPQDRVCKADTYLTTTLFAYLSMRRSVSCVPTDTCGHFASRIANPTRSYLTLSDISSKGDDTTQAIHPQASVWRTGQRYRAAHSASGCATSRLAGAGS